MTETSRWRT